MLAFIDSVLFVSGYAILSSTLQPGCCLSQGSTDEWKYPMGLRASSHGFSYGLSTNCSCRLPVSGTVKQNKRWSYVKLEAFLAKNENC